MVAVVEIAGKVLETVKIFELLELLNNNEAPSVVNVVTSSTAKELDILLKYCS